MQYAHYVLYTQGWCVMVGIVAAFHLIIWAPILPQPDRHCEAQLNKQVFHVLTMDTTLKVVQSLETKRQAIIGKQS